MALQPCTQCGHTISTRALACPMCGAPGEGATAPRPARPAPEAAPAAAPPPFPAMPGAVGPLGASPAPSPAAPSARVSAGGPSKALLVVGALALALVGAMIDSALHNALSGSPRAPLRDPLADSAAAQGAADTAEMKGIIAQGLQGRDPQAAIDTVRLYQAGAKALRAETEMRLTLADITTKQEMRYASTTEYADNVEALQIVERKGVHVAFSGGGQAGWSATATHDAFPGRTCRAGVGPDHPQAGKIVCEGGDTAQMRLVKP